jgi:hypothetical protein
MLFKCPKQATLTEVTPTACPIKFDQIQKLAIGRLISEARFDSIVGAEGKPITDQAIWTALLAATDDTKIVVTPYFSGFSIPATEAIKQGGNDNTTLNGVSEVMGGQMVTVPFVLKNVSSETAKGLRLLATESMLQPGETNIGGYFFATDNNIVFDGGADGTEFLPFEIYNMFVPDVASEGLNTNNTYNCSFEMRFGWSENWKAVKADFNPRSL